MEHLEAVRTPSTSSAHSEMEPTSSSLTTAATSQSAERRIFKLVSPLGGTQVTLEWNHDSPPIDTVNIWLTVIGQFVHKFSALSVAFQKQKDEHGDIHPLTLSLPDPRKPLDPADPTDAEFGDTVKERYFNKFKRIMSVFSHAVKTFKDLWQGATMHEGKSWCQDRCDQALLTLICNITFNSSVTSIKSLNSHYAPFSSEVYGETKYEQMQLIIEQLNFKDSDIFLDLGSGVGHLVLYVAGATKVKKAIGIEKAEVPATYAQKMKVEWMKWMSYFKKKYCKFEIHNGDFLSDDFRELIHSATIIFINNFAFTSDLEERIKFEIINELTTGTRIVTTKPYASINGAISKNNMRHSNRMDNILDVVELRTVPQPTSWTDKTVPYYLHTVNQAKLQEYFDAQKKPSSQQSSRHASTSSKSSTSSRESSHAIETTPAVPRNLQQQQQQRPSNPLKQAAPPDSAQEDVVYGRTTRKQWKAQHGEATPPRKTSPAWDAPDREYLPPTAKKAQKASSKPPTVTVKKEKKEPKREKKTAAGRLSEEAASTLDMFHMKSGPQQPLETTGPGLQRVLLDDMKENAAGEGGLPDQLVLCRENPLDNVIMQWHQGLHEYLKYLQRDETVQDLLAEIEQQRLRNADLNAQKMAKEGQVHAELIKGRQNLFDRTEELGIPQAETPADLLNHSKKIVADHKELTQSVSHMEADVAQLSCKTRNIVPYGPQVLDGMSMLDDPAAFDPEQGPIYAQYLNKIAVENGYPPPKEPEPEAQQPAAEAILSPGTGTAAARQRRAKPRNGPGGRKGKGQDSENSEELDRQVQEFVAVAMHVDQQAKERERKARAAAACPTTEKPKKSTSSAPPHDSGVPLPRTAFPPPTTISASGLSAPYPVDTASVMHMPPPHFQGDA